MHAADQHHAQCCEQGKASSISGHVLTTSCPLESSAGQPTRVLSMIASGLSPTRTSTDVTPSIDRNCCAGTLIGPGDAAEPGAGWGKAVDRAVWKVMLPSTFWTIW